MNAVAALPVHPGAELLLDVPAADYHRRELGVASASTLKLIRDRSPAHYRAWIDATDDHETPALLFGRAYHMRVLEPERFAATYVAPPENPPRRPTEAQRNAKKPSDDTIAAIAFWDAWNAENAGKETLTRDDFERIEAMHAALMQHPLAAGIMRAGHSEVTMRWIDEQSGVQCKARADWWVPGKFFMDLKTTEDASPRAFVRSIEKYGYHVQHAHYCDGARACGETIRNYLILAQEKEPPYAAAVYHIDAAAEIRGFELRERGLQTVRECLDSNTWPAYGTGITELSLPPWALKDDQ